MSESDLSRPPDSPSSISTVDFELLCNESPELFLILDPDLNIVAASNAYLSATRTKRESVMGRNIFDVFPDNADDPAATGERNLRDSLERVVRERVSDAMAVQKYPIRKPESEGGGFEVRYWSPSNHPVVDAQDRLAYVIHRVQDVTVLVELSQGSDAERMNEEMRWRTEQMKEEILLRGIEIQEANRNLREANRELNELRDQLERKADQHEEALRATDEMFRLLVEGIKDYAIFMLDRDGTVVSWNTGASRLHGASAEEMIGKNYSSFFMPKDRETNWPQRRLELAAQRGSIHEEGWRLRNDGSRFRVEGTLTALFDRDGRVRGYAKVLRDLSDSQRNELILKSVVDTAIDGIITIDSRGTVQTFNRAAEAIFGYAATEVVGNNVRMLMPEPYHSEHDGYLEAYQRTHHAKIIGIGREVMGRRKNATTFPMELSVSEFQLDGKPCFTGLVRDISARKKMEGQLQQAQKMEAVGELAAGVAHDFNNLLTVVSGYCDLLLMGLPAGDKSVLLVGEIRDAAGRATALTSQLLAFSRRQVLEPKVFDLNAAIVEVEKLLRRLIGEDIELATSLSADLYPVKADPGRIDQVLMNLIVNARDAMPQGGKLTIETANAQFDETTASVTGVAPGAYALVVITDTGCGMSADTVSRIFEPFFTTKTVGKGTGLGLSVVHGIVKQSGGHIDVYSEPDIGTAFKIYLPAVEGVRAVESAPADSQRLEGNETVLLVEDDRAVRGFAAVALQQYGYTVLEAPSGAVALALMENHEGQIDVLVTDVVMPGMSGRALSEVVRDRYPSLKVLCMSGYTDDAVVRHGILKAEIAFLQKPFTPAMLARKIRELLDSPTGVDAPSRQNS